MPLTCSCGQQLYTAAEVAKMLGVSRQRVNVLISQGRIKAQRLKISNQGVWMICAEDVRVAGARGREPMA